MLKRAVVSLIQAYQGYLRGMWPAACRFSPSCSEYTKQAVLKYGFFKGGFKSTKRILSCHPFSKKDSIDPVA